MKWAGLAIGAIALFASSIAAAGVRQGVDAYKAGDYSRALEEWLPAAAENNPYALFNMGQLYRLGHGVERDLEIAEHYYRRAAELGHVSAQGNLGALYLEPGSPVFDAAKGERWLRQAASNGNVLSRYMLGVLYFNGEHVTRDFVEAYAWTSLASADGSTDAAAAEKTMAPHLSLAEIAEGKKRASAILAEAYEKTPKAHAGAANPSKPVEAMAVDAMTSDDDAVTVRKQATAARTVSPPDSKPNAQKPTAEAAIAAKAQSPEAKAPPTLAEAEQAASVAPTAGLAVPPSRPTTKDAGGFRIQLLSLPDEERVHDAWHSLAKKHSALLGKLEPFVLRADLGPDKGVYYRLRAGEFDTHAEAKAVCESLSEVRVGCLVVNR